MSFRYWTSCNNWLSGLHSKSRLFVDTLVLVKTNSFSLRADGWDEVAGIQELGVHACY